MKGLPTAQWLNTPYLHPQQNGSTLPISIPSTMAQCSLSPSTAQWLNAPYLHPLHNGSTLPISIPSTMAQCSLSPSPTQWLNAPYLHPLHNGSMLPISIPTQWLHAPYLHPQHNDSPCKPDEHPQTNQSAQWDVYHTAALARGREGGRVGGRERGRERGREGGREGGSSEVVGMEETAMIHQYSLKTLKFIKSVTWLQPALWYKLHFINIMLQTSGLKPQAEYCKHLIWKAYEYDKGYKTFQGISKASTCN